MSVVSIGDMLIGNVSLEDMMDIKESMEDSDLRETILDTIVEKSRTPVMDELPMGDKIFINGYSRHSRTGKPIFVKGYWRHKRSK